MIQACSSFFNRIMQRYTPDPFVFTLLMTLAVFFSALGLTSHTSAQLVTYWGDGFWKLTVFTMQMVMVLISGYVVASAPIIDKFLTRLSRQITTPTQAALTTTLIATTGCWINWGFGLIAGAIVAQKIIKTLPAANFKLLVACAYSGFIVWHGGLSGSIPLLIATPGNFTEALMGGIVPVEQTIFSSFNLWLSSAVAFVTVLTNYLMARGVHSTPVYLKEENYAQISSPAHTKVPAEHLETSHILAALVALMAFSYVGFKIYNKNFSMNLNNTNFLFLFLGFSFHGNARQFIKAVTHAAKKVGPILLQFPFYAGIMGLMTSSDLVHIISDYFVRLSNLDTFYLYTFYSAGLLNLFVPSGGGQWAIQGPIMIEAARVMGADTIKTAMAIAWGDAWTNMVQPFWALPTLAIAGLHLRDMIGYCIIIFFSTGIVISLFFYFF